DMENRDGPTQVLLELGHIEHLQGNVARAAEYFAESLPLCRETGHLRDIAYCLEGLAAVASAQQRPGRAARLFGAAEALPDSRMSPLPPVNRSSYERDVAAACAQIDEEAFEAAWAAGRALPLEQAIAEALGIHA